MYLTRCVEPWRPSTVRSRRDILRSWRTDGGSSTCILPVMTITKNTQHCPKQTGSPPFVAYWRRILYMNLSRCDDHQEYPTLSEADRIPSVLGVLTEDLLHVSYPLWPALRRPATVRSRQDPLRSWRTDGGSSTCISPVVTSPENTQHCPKQTGSPPFLAYWRGIFYMCLTGLLPVVTSSKNTQHCPKQTGSPPFLAYWRGIFYMCLTRCDQPWEYPALSEADRIPSVLGVLTEDLLSYPLWRALRRPSIVRSRQDPLRSLRTDGGSSHCQSTWSASLPLHSFRSSYPPAPRYHHSCSPVNKKFRYGGIFVWSIIAYTYTH